MNATEPLQPLCCGVVFVITKLGVGGAELMLLRLVSTSQLFRRGRLIALLKGGELATHFSRIGVAANECEGRSFADSAIRVARLLYSLWRTPPTVVCSWLYHSDLFSSLVYFFLGGRCVWNIRSSTCSNVGTRLRTRMVIRINAVLSHLVPAAIVSCSREAIKVHVGYGYCKERMVYIPNGFDVSKFAFSPGRRVNARKRWGVRLDVITVGIVARHDPQKNHAGFFRLIACLRDYLPHVVGVGIGTGISYETPELSSAARTHGVDQNVVLLGPSKEIHEDYSGLDFVVCVSTFGEAFPNVLAEAMCAGCHVLSFDVGDARNILGNPASVFAVGDIAGMARRIVTLARSWCDGVLPRDSQALPRISEHFNLDTVVQRYEQLLRSSPERGIL